MQPLQIAAHAYRLLDQSRHFAIGHEFHVSPKHLAIPSIVLRLLHSLVHLVAPCLQVRLIVFGWFENVARQVLRLALKKLPGLMNQSHQVPL